MQEEKFNKQDGNLDQPNVNESLALAGLFRKVSAKERLPKEDGTYICFISCCAEPKEGCSTGWGDCDFQDGKFRLTEERCLFWLEQIELPNDDRVILGMYNTIPITDTDHMVRGIEINTTLKTLKWVRDFVLAGKAVTAKDNVR